MLSATKIAINTVTLLDTVEDLLKEVPPKAQNLVVVVHSKHYKDIEGATITVNHKKYKIRFYPVSQGRPSGSVWISYIARPSK